MLHGDLLPRFIGHLTAVDRFDAAVFGMSRGDAAAADPQQRLLLERTTEAILCSGAPADNGVVREDRVGVFVGISSMDYAGLTAALTPDVTAFTATGV